jgi:hypothetical protein
MDVKRSLRRAVAHHASVKVSRRTRDEPNIHGFPLAVGPAFALLRVLHDFDLDGYMVLPLDRITDVRSGVNERFLEHVTRDEGQLSSVWPPLAAPIWSDLPLNAWQDLFAALGATRQIIIVECETRDEDGFFIGPVVGVAEHAVGIHHFDATAVWDPAPSEVLFKAITCVRFDERYTNVYARYVGDPPAS